MGEWERGDGNGGCEKGEGWEWGMWEWGMWEWGDVGMWECGRWEMGMWEWGCGNGEMGMGPSRDRDGNGC